MISWANFLKEVISDFKEKEHNFNPIAEVNVITIAIANKNDMSFDFYNKNKMHAVKWKLNAMINKNKNLIEKLNRNWRHPLIENFKQVPISSFLYQ